MSQYARTADNMKHVSTDALKLARAAKRQGQPRNIVQALILKIVSSKAPKPPPRKGRAP
jgi:hypothetical protein